METQIKEKELILAPIGITLGRFIKISEESYSEATGELSQLMRDLVLAAKLIHKEVNRAGLADILGSYGKENIQGEEQQKLDVIANSRFISSLKHGGEVCAIISEEEEHIINTDNNEGKYVVSIDPLDGSSNIDVNVSIGTIFSIYKRKSKVGSKAIAEDFLQKGTEQVAAGYVLYGSSTMLVYSTGRGVNGFTYDPSLGEFFLSHPLMKIIKDGKIYSCNEGSVNRFPEAVKKYIGYCKEQSYTARYIGSLVADFHRNLLKGGIFFYPSTTNNPNGKLRLLYECNAMAFIVEQAGGKASNGNNRILEIQPTEFHQRTPIFIGSTNMVNKMESYFLEGNKGNREIRE